MSEADQRSISVKKNVQSCLANAILNGESDGLLMPHYKSLEEYSSSVANQLPQRQAFYTADLADVLWKVEDWKKWLPRVDIFYAVKVNTDPVLLKLLTLLGLSFDCATQGEIEMVLSAGASPQNIVFAHTIKTDEELQFASDVGVDMMTFDNEEELLKIKRVFPNARLLLRLSPTKVNCFFDLSDKFGCNEDEAPELLALAKELGLQVIGISFHVGALCEDPASYTSTIYKCRQLFDEAKEMGFNFSILDIGGGFFGQTGTEGIFHKVASAIREALDENFPGDDVRLIAEPGCYFAASAFNLVCTVIGKRILKNTKPGQPTRQYYLNDGVYGGFFKNNDQYLFKIKPLLSVSRPVSDSRIFGQTCCCMDVIRTNTPLPELDVGERVIWSNMGAYCRGVSSTFCGVPLPELRYVFVKNERLSMDWIKNKKTVKDFLRNHAVIIGCNDKVL